MEIKYQNLRVLGPAILKVKIPDEILNVLNEYIDKIINDDSKLKKLNYGEALVGDVTQEFLLEVEFVKSSGWLSGEIFDYTNSYKLAFLNGIFWNIINVSIMIYLYLVYKNSKRIND